MASPTAHPKPTRLYFYTIITLLLVLNGALLWRDYQKEGELQNLWQSMYNAQVEVRVLKSEKIFGAPFVPQFHTVDLSGQPEVLPDFGKGQQLLLFFQSWHCATCLAAMSAFESVIGEDVPVIGVAQEKSPEEVTRILNAYEYKFPVYLAVDAPFDLAFSPYSVLIDGAGNVLHLSPIDSDLQSAERLISELTQLLERR